MWLSGLSAGLRTKRCWFDSQLRHMLPLWATSPVGGLQEATDWCIFHTSMFLSLSFSLPYPLSRSKWIKSLKKKIYQINWLVQTFRLNNSALSSSFPLWYILDTQSKLLLQHNKWPVKYNKLKYYPNFNWIIKFSLWRPYPFPFSVSCFTHHYASILIKNHWYYLAAKKTKTWLL